MKILVLSSTQENASGTSSGYYVTLLVKDDTPVIRRRLQAEHEALLREQGWVGDIDHEWSDPDPDDFAVRGDEFVADLAWQLESGATG